MGNSEPKWSEEKAEETMSNLLRFGVLLSAAFVLIGGVFYLLRYGGMRPNYEIFRGEPQELRSAPSTIAFALQGHRRGIIQAGLLLLIATPIARVVFSVYVFFREKDRLYVAITLLVLVVLLYSLIWGR